MNIVGISAYYHDSACCLLQDGVLKAAAQQERFSRRKHDASTPKDAFRYCLRAADLSIRDVDCIAYYEDPTKKLGRQLASDVSAQQLERLWRRAKLPELEIREVLGYEGPIEVVDHHQAHAASAFAFSGFDEAATLTVDGVGEWATTTYGIGRGAALELFEEVRFPDSLGLLYSTITNYLGFSVNDGEYKVMGLAPYGAPTLLDRLRRLIESGPGGQYRLSLEYFDFERSDRMFTDALAELLGGGPREPREPITPFHQDLARSLQALTEETLLEKVRYLFERTRVEALCLAGGVALNCVANGRIRREGPFADMFVQPAAGDAGGAVGAAALAHMKLTGRAMRSRMKSAALGPKYSNEDIAAFLSGKVAADDFSGREHALVESEAGHLAAGKVIGWFHGRMEFGPRALGSRSILADPRGATMRDEINARIKRREDFRPFAPCVLEERAAEHFDLTHPSPFMLETCPVRSPLLLPAITHVDGSARVQTINRVTSPRVARLLDAFARRTGCPMLLNTSFNMKDEPIVCSPLDAFECFVRAGIDVLVLEDFVVDRASLDDRWVRLLGGHLSVPAERIQPVYTFA
jgi:carbamoyltransferase